MALEKLRMRKSVAIRTVIGVLGIATLVVVGGLANADITPPPPSLTGCDFLTGGGFIFPTASKGTFAIGGGCRHGSRSEEHTSELQSRSDLVCRLLLEKKKNSNPRHSTDVHDPLPASYPDIARALSPGTFRASS